jgi:hypothetical protein
MEALKLSEQEKLTKTDLIYLTLNLNFSVFLHDIEDKRTEAIKQAKKILYDTLKEIEEVTDNQQKDTILICQMIKDNLSLWKNEMSEEFINLETK